MARKRGTYTRPPGATWTNRYGGWNRASRVDARRKRRALGMTILGGSIRGEVRRRLGMQPRVHWQRVREGDAERRRRETGGHEP